MKCARCLWAYKSAQTGVKYASDAVTIYKGSALCAEHLMLEKDLKK